IAERAIRAIDEGGGLEGARLRLRARSLVEVGMVAARELVEAPLQRLRIDPELARQPEHLEVVSHDLREMRTGPRGPVQDLRASLRAAYATVLRRKRGSTATARLGLGVDEGESSLQPFRHVVEGGPVQVEVALGVTHHGDAVQLELLVVLA